MAIPFKSPRPKHVFDPDDEIAGSELRLVRTAAAEALRQADLGALPDRHRIAVALGGMYVESIVAGIAALVWAGSPPGLVHDEAVERRPQRPAETLPG